MVDLATAERAFELADMTGSTGPDLDAPEKSPDIEKFVFESPLLTEPDKHIAGLKVGRVACLGPENSFSWSITRTLCPRAELVTVKSLSALGPELKSNPDMFGILPIQNTIKGDIFPVVQMLMPDIPDDHVERDERGEIIKPPFDPLLGLGQFEILGEAVLPIDLMLAGKGSDIQKIHTIYSIKAALDQARNFLKRHRKQNPYLELIETESTSEAAQIVKQLGGTAAAICSRRAAKAADLNITDEGTSIQDRKGNATRFLIVKARTNPVLHVPWLLRNTVAAAESRLACVVEADKDVGGMNNLFDFIREHGIRYPFLHFVPKDDAEGGDVQHGIMEFTGHPAILKRVFTQERELLEEAGGIKFDVIGGYPVGNRYEPQ